MRQHSSTNIIHQNITKRFFLGTCSHSPHYQIFLKQPTIKMTDWTTGHSAYWTVDGQWAASRREVARLGQRKSCSSWWSGGGGGGGGVKISRYLGRLYTSPSPRHHYQTSYNWWLVNSQETALTLSHLRLIVNISSSDHHNRKYCWSALCSTTSSHHRFTFSDQIFCWHSQ